MEPHSELLEEQQEIIWRAHFNPGLTAAPIHHALVLAGDAWFLMAGIYVPRINVYNIALAQMGVENQP